MKIEFLEKDIVGTDGFVRIDENLYIDIYEKICVLTYRGEIISELNKKEAALIKLSLKPSRIRNRFKNRFCIKEILVDGEFIANYRKDCMVRDFKDYVRSTLSGFYNNKKK